MQEVRKINNLQSEDFSDVSFGERLKAVREARGYTYRGLANKAGIAKSTIYFYETKGYMPNVTTLELLCKALNISASDLLGF